MKAAFTGCITLALVFSGTPPCLSGEEERPGKVILQEDARILSARLYSAILIRACQNGWRYPLKHVRNGFKRHFEEFKLQLSNDGYTIVSTGAADGESKRPAILTMADITRTSARFGCARRYWLED
ncbi:hypothetical protein OIU34_04115 [Pararhizobium sp. BT-229]|uniref:hypothetical protein n=1 Tax=Pararhizobium sp. BT-229 TaxID=2986923 RepID=UPI0021F7CB82|nr:hypothetical protein [Pararhizobium sp. BT-229]MCV9961077.1 hypothetical protein [Pararhizobium sp. BT-229]